MPRILQPFYSVALSFWFFQRFPCHLCSPLLNVQSPATRALVPTSKLYILYSASSTDTEIEMHIEGVDMGWTSLPFKLATETCCTSHLPILSDQKLDTRSLHQRYTLTLPHMLSHNLFPDSRIADGWMILFEHCEMADDMGFLHLASFINTLMLLPCVQTRPDRLPDVSPTHHWE